MSTWPTEEDARFREEVDGKNVTPLRPAGAGAALQYRVDYTKNGKLILPGAPAYNDPAGLCAWLDCAFNLDRGYPIARGVRSGLRGPEGLVMLTRVGAPSIRFEPASRINTPLRLIETLSWYTIPTDGVIHELQGPHCKAISDVIKKLCGLHDTMTDSQEAEGIIGTFLARAVEAEGKLTSYGGTVDRFKAAKALHRLRDAAGKTAGPPLYFVDFNTGEYVIGLSDLREVAREHIGSSLPHGWLDGRMEACGWPRITIDGRADPGRSGANSAHARTDAYRGHLRPPEA